MHPPSPESHYTSMQVSFRSTATVRCRLRRPFISVGNREGNVRFHLPLTLTLTLTLHFTSDVWIHVGGGDMCLHVNTTAATAIGSGSESVGAHYDFDLLLLPSFDLGSSERTEKKKKEE